MIVLFMGLVLSGGADLDELARRYDVTWTCDPATGRHVIEADGLTLVVVPGFKTALFNGQARSLDAPAEVVDGKLRLPPVVAAEIRNQAAVKASAKPLAPTPPPRKNREPALLSGFKIVLDPGHGGIHTGYVGRHGVRESDINLDVALELSRILRGSGAGVEVTRVTDRHFSTRVDDDLDERVGFVNALRPDLFLSIHTNGVERPEPRGFEVWVPRHASGARNADSREIAELIRRELEEVWGREDRGTKDARNLRVLNGTRCPAALVELEFVSNPEVERKLGSSAVRLRLAEALARAVKNWCLRRR